MNLDPFNEFPYLAKRQEIQFEYLKSVRHLIDSRISDSDIMMLRDMGIDAVALCKEKIKSYE
jgi:hypothetical protein